MSVIAVKEIHGDRDFESSPGERRYTRVYHLKTNQRHDEGFVIQAAATAFNFPKVGQNHHKDNDARCVSVRGINTAGFLWTLTAGYSTDSEKAEDPLNDPIEYEWQDERESTTTLKDANGNTMVTSAGQAYDPHEINGLATVCRWNVNIEDGPPPDWRFDLARGPQSRPTINDRAVIIDGRQFDIGEVLWLGSGLGPTKTRNDVKYRVASIAVAIDQEANWQADRIDEGTEIVDPGNPLQRVKPQLDGDGSVPVGKILLDGAGGVLANPSATNIEFNTFDIFTQVDLSVAPGIDAA